MAVDTLTSIKMFLGSLGTIARGTLRITCPSWFVGQRLADKNQLVPVLTGHPVAHADLYIVHVSRRNAPLKIRSFVDFFLKAVSTEEERASAAAA